jgi:cobalt/nickel transport protein
MPEEELFLQDTVVAVVHVQAEKGWDRAVQTGPVEVRPLTRPYGLWPGMVFQVETNKRPPLALGSRDTDKFWLPANDRVEAEVYHATPPKELPADEFRTRTVKPSRGGVSTCTLTEVGWWAITVVHGYEGKMDHEGKKYPLQPRTTFWARVDEPKPEGR